MELELDEEREDLVNEIYHLIDYVFPGKRAAEHCSLFYILYYLVKFKDRGELLYYFNKETQILSDAFYYAGVFACGREACHIVDECWFEITYDWAYNWADVTFEYANFRTDYIKDSIGTEDKFFCLLDGFTDIESYEYPDVMDAMVELVEETYDLTKKEKKIIRGLTGVWFLRDYEDTLLDTYYYLELFCNAFTEPKAFLDTCIYIFEEFNWGSSFGGDPWAALAKIIRNKDEYTRAMFVDLCWDLEHNTGNWLNKFNANIFTLRTVLDAKLAGHFDYIFPFALNLLPKLRRYKLYLPPSEKPMGTWGERFAKQRVDPSLRDWVAFQKRNYSYINKLVKGRR